MSVSLQLIKDLRNITSASIIECKKALETANGDIKAATEILHKKGLEIVAKKAARAAKEGRVESYVHAGNKIGVLVEVNSETDFVARNETFCQFAKDVAMQIAAMNPRYIKKEDVPKDLLDKIEKQEEKDKFCKENCLLEQPFIKDASLIIQDYMNSLIVKMGENIVVKRFTRFQLGEE